jgi:hydrogenase 3 maturation protease
LVGIGNELNGDDAAGVRVVRTLKSRLPERSDLLLLEAGLAPENFTGVLRRFSPGLVVMIDAAQIDEIPGMVRWYPLQASGGMSASTHAQPISTLAEYLVLELGCQVFLLCIQPGAFLSGKSLSAPVRSAIRRVVNTFVNFYH